MVSLNAQIVLSLKAHTPCLRKLAFHTHSGVRCPIPTSIFGTWFHLRGILAKYLRRFKLVNNKTYRIYGRLVSICENTPWR